LIYTNKRLIDHKISQISTIKIFLMSELTIVEQQIE